MKGDIKPLFPYAGGKRSSLPMIAPYLQRTATYVEPFFGAGAVFCYMVNMSRAKNFVINDIRSEITDIYRAVRDNANEMISESQCLVSEYIAKDAGGREALYYEVRDSWNRCGSPAKALFLLNTNFGGLFMVNKHTGVYNTASGHSRFDNRKMLSIDADNILGWSKALNATEIITGSYINAKIPDNDTIIFCDPPYRNTGFGYELEFSEQDQIGCFNWCNNKAMSKHVSVILTNNDTGNFFSNLAVGAPVKTLKYDISYSGGEATKSSEMVMVWNEKKSHLIK